jgi:PmbA protein
MSEIEKLVMDERHLKEYAEKILQEATRAGATQVEIDIAANKGFSVSAHEGSVETVEYHRDKTIDITVYFGKRSGSASLSDLRDSAIKNAVASACHIAKFTDMDPDSGLPDRELLAFNYSRLESSYPWHLSVEQAITLACECEQRARAMNSLIMNAEDVRVATLQSMYVYANSYGFVGVFPSTQHEISCVLIAKKAGEMQREYSYTTAVDPSDLLSVNAIAEQAVRNTVARLGARRIQTTRAPVIFVAEQARGVLGHFAAAINGAHLYRKSSFLLGKLGEKIFPHFIHIQEQPHLAKALGTAPFDDEGVATRDNVFIQDGVLRSYALDVYSARKLGMETTGNAGGVHNLTINHGDKDLAGLIKEMDKGLVVTELMGQGVNLVTGDYSRGAAGFWVENGEVQYPVHEITIAGNLAEMYSKIAAVGNDVDRRGNVRTGSLLISDMMIAGA